MTCGIHWQGKFITVKSYVLLPEVVIDLSLNLQASHGIIKSIVELIFADYTGMYNTKSLEFKRVIHGEFLLWVLTQM